MKVTILFRTTEGPWGGGNSFLRSLRAALRKLGVEVLDHLTDDVDAVLVNSSYLGVGGSRLTAAVASELNRSGRRHWAIALFRGNLWKKRGFKPPFVHRLDGVFRLYGRDARDSADAAQVAINEFMDWTVYQSEFCRASFTAEGLRVCRSSIIYNGVDTSIFYPANTRSLERRFRIVSVAWSPNPLKGAPMAAELSRNRNVDVTFVGQWPTGLSAENVRVVGPMRHSDLACLLRQQDCLLHMAQNDPCSNAVMEGIASGLPVIFHPSGGTPEIVGDCGIGCSGDLHGAVIEMMQRYEEYRSRAIARRNAFAVSEAAKRYASLFEQLRTQAQ